MYKTTSRDGTTIAFDRYGDGPPVILLAGALGYRSFDPLMTELTTLLASRFTVYHYDRRGRGDSGDTPLYAVEREIEDLDAIVTEAGGSASVYSISSGGVLVLRAAAHGVALAKLALYEPPFIIDDSRPPVPADYVSRLEKSVSAGRPGDAVELFMAEAVRVPEEILAQLRESPMWPALEAVAHTLAYDGMIMGGTQSGKPLSDQGWSSVTAPTLVVDGGASEPFLHHAAQALVDILPNATRRTLPGQDHAVSATAIAPVLAEFFAK